jgi:hypothetical protein
LVIVREFVAVAGGADEVDNAAEIVTVAVAAPALLVAVSVYRVLVAGVTVVDPEALVEVKAPGAIATEVAPVVFQDNVADCPAVMELGEAKNAVILGTDTGAPADTEMAAVAVTDPELLVAVSV